MPLYVWHQIGSLRPEVNSMKHERFHHKLHEVIVDKVIATVQGLLQMHQLCHNDTYRIFCSEIKELSKHTHIKVPQSTMPVHGDTTFSGAWDLG